MVFALIGMGLFGGKFSDCSAPGAEYPGGKVECSGYHVFNEGFRNGVMVPRAWQNPFFNFDTFYMAGLTLFR